MSYIKRTVSAVDVITFYFVTSTIFNEVSEASSFKAASTKDETGKPDFDRIQISDDEKNFMKKYLKEAMLEVFSVMFKIIKGNSVNHDTGLVLGSSSTINSGSFVVGNGYTIKEAGSTDFTLIGAADSVIGTSFIATGVGTGNGTAYLTPFCSYVDINDNEKYREINLALLDQKINNALNDFILYKWYFLKGLADAAAIHKAEFDNGVKQISEKTLTLRQPN